MDCLRSYKGSLNYAAFNDRLEYLKLYDNNVKSPRSISQEFYKSDLWLKLRVDIIARDFGCDLGIPGLYINGPIIIHHIDPITEYDINNHSKKLLDPDNLISSSITTHNMIHYSRKIIPYVERRKGDTTGWKNLDMSKIKSLIQ